MPHAVVNERQRVRARQLRQTMTRAETLLWRHIKANRIDGLGIRRQVPFRNYIADFVCFAAKVIVELDGESHDFAERQSADRNRDAFFAEQGFKVLRFTNEQVMSNLEGVVEAICQTIAHRAGGLPPSPPLPHKGGGNGEAGASRHEITNDTTIRADRGIQP
jgi:very-short-patch-repair endonuclease